MKGIQPIQQWKEQQDRSIRVVAFGSSNTAQSWSNGGRHNWVDWLQLNLKMHVGHHVTIFNQGISGETTEDLLKRIDRDVLSYDPDLVIVTVGGNDSKNVHRNITLQRYTDNLRRICSLILGRQALPVLQTYYCPMYHLNAEGFRETFESYMEANRLLAREMDLPLIDQYNRFEPLYTRHPEPYGQLMRDWIHVNHLGNLLMGQHISHDFGLPELPVPPDIREPFGALMNQLRLHETPQ